MGARQRGFQIHVHVELLVIVLQVTQLTTRVRLVNVHIRLDFPIQFRITANLLDQTFAFRYRVLIIHLQIDGDVHPLVLKLEQFTFQPFKGRLLRVDTHLDLDITLQTSQLGLQCALVEFGLELDRRLGIVADLGEFRLQHGHTLRRRVQILDEPARVRELQPAKCAAQRVHIALGLEQRLRELTLPVVVAAHLFGRLAEHVRVPFQVTFQTLIA